MVFGTIVDKIMDQLALLRTKQRQVRDSNFANTKIRRLTRNSWLLTQQAKDMDKAERQGIHLPKYVLEDFNYHLRSIQDGIHDLNVYLSVNEEKATSGSSSSSRGRETRSNQTRPENRLPEQDGRNFQEKRTHESESPLRPCSCWSNSPNSSWTSPGSSLASSPCLCKNCAPSSPASSLYSVLSLGSSEEGNGGISGDDGEVCPSSMFCQICQGQLTPATPAGSVSSWSCFGISEPSTPRSIRSGHRGLVTPPRSVTSPSESSDSGISCNSQSSLNSGF